MVILPPISIVPVTSKSPSIFALDFISTIPVPAGFSIKSVSSVVVTISLSLI